MKPLTNSQIAVRETPEMRSARVGCAAEVCSQSVLARSHSLVWDGSGGKAEIRDEANRGTVVFRGSLAECRAEIERRGLTIRS